MNAAAETIESIILANINEAVVAVDAEGRIVLVNRAFASLLSLDPSRAAGRRYDEVLPPGRLSQMLARVLRDRVPCVEEVAVRLPEERLFEAHGVPLGPERPAAGALVLHDITRLRRLESLRREFVANVSHELRTPLASIRGLAETLSAGAIDDPEHRLEFVKDIEKDAERLTALVDDLLDLSAIESGHREPVRESLALLPLAREAAASLRPQAERRGIRIEVLESALPDVRADRSQIKQVLTNLLDNAVKYTGDGGRVRVSASAGPEGVRLSVQDTGCGIPERDLPRVFERFYRVDKARSRELGGTGLGLSIVKHLVETHGGTVTVESRVGEGSTFHVTLPVA